MRAILLIACLVFLFSCDRERPACFMRAGEETTVIRSLPEGIQTLEVYDLVDVEVYQDDRNEVVLRGPENVIRKIKTPTESGTVRIEDTNRCNWVRDLSIRPTIEFHLPSITHVKYEGQGDVLFVDSLEAEVFTFEGRASAGDIFLRLNVDSANIEVHTGLSDIEIQGTARIVGLFNQGYGFMNAEDLDAQFVLSNNSSINWMRVRCEQYLYARINDRGNLEYYGTPNTVDQQLNGDGELIALD